MKYRPAAILTSAAVLAALSACGIPGNYPGGPLASEDRYCYVSTVDYPQTLTLVDVRSGEQIWSVDIPIGQQCVVRFFEDYKTDNPQRPDLMRWQLQKAGKTFGDLDNAMPVPAADSRRVDVTFRTGDGAKAAPVSRSSQ